ncbi:hypothetical protein LB503_011634 [Fusarium chuoi]|nr:hypothetical protein LB503_011634 [Fusarium chuoi]
MNREKTNDTSLRKASLMEDEAIVPKLNPRIIFIIIFLGFGSASMGYASSIIATTLSQPSWRNIRHYCPHRGHQRRLLRRRSVWVHLQWLLCTQIRAQEVCCTRCTHHPHIQCSYNGLLSHRHVHHFQGLPGMGIVSDVIYNSDVDG